MLHKFSHSVKQTVCVCFYVLQRKKNLALEIYAREEFSGIFFFLWSIISTFTDYVCLIICMWTMMNRSTHSAYYHPMKRTQDPDSGLGFLLKKEKNRISKKEDGGQSVERLRQFATMACSPFTLFIGNG